MRSALVKLLAALCLVALVATGCGKAGETDSGKDSSSASTKVSLPSGDKWVEDTKAGVRFAVPSDWTEVSPAEALKNKQVPPALEEFAKSKGMTGEQLLQQIGQQLSLFVLGQKKAGFTPNINVQALSTASLPTREQLTQQFAGMKITVQEYADVATPVGKGKQLEYDYQLGTATASGRIVAVKHAGGIVLVTITAGDEDSAKKIAKDVTSTISKRG